MSPYLYLPSLFKGYTNASFFNFLSCNCGPDLMNGCMRAIGHSTNENSPD